MRSNTTVAHPWHGIDIGRDAPETVSAFIEIVPLDTVKYELDKESGHLKIDRPHPYSSLCPTLYGFIPQTCCGDRVAELARRTLPHIHRGDKDPLDICVLTEPAITRSYIIVSVRPVGGFRLIDRGEADDKIIAVLSGDAAFDSVRKISEIPESMIDRLRHYFLTYRGFPGGQKELGPIEITDMYGREVALNVIRESMRDYEEQFGWIKAEEETEPRGQ